MLNISLDMQISAYFPKRPILTRTNYFCIKIGSTNALILYIMVQAKMATIAPDNKSLQGTSSASQLSLLQIFLTGSLLCVTAQSGTDYQEPTLSSSVVPNAMVHSHRHHHSDLLPPCLDVDPPPVPPPVLAFICSIWVWSVLLLSEPIWKHSSWLCITW